MPANDPNAYKVPGDPQSGLRRGLLSAFGETSEASETGPGGVEQEVIDGYMTLTPQEKRVLLKAMDGGLGAILSKVLPPELNDLIAEAVNTAPERIGPGTALPQSAGRVGV